MLPPHSAPANRPPNNHFAEVSRGWGGRSFYSLHFWMYDQFKYTPALRQESQQHHNLKLLLLHSPQKGCLKVLISQELHLLPLTSFWDKKVNDCYHLENVRKKNKQTNKKGVNAEASQNKCKHKKVTSHLAAELKAHPPHSDITYLLGTTAMTPVSTKLPGKGRLWEAWAFSLGAMQNTAAVRCQT